MAERKTATSKTKSIKAATVKKKASSPKKKAAAGRKITTTGGQANTSRKRSPLALSPERREHMIREAAYYRAERRGFVGGDPQRDWLEAEEEIERHLGAR